MITSNPLQLQTTFPESFQITRNRFNVHPGGSLKGTESDGTVLCCHVVRLIQPNSLLILYIILLIQPVLLVLL